MGMAVAVQICGVGAKSFGGAKMCFVVTMISRQDDSENELPAQSYQRIIRGNRFRKINLQDAVAKKVSMAGIYNELLSSIPDVEKGAAFSIEATDRMQFELLAKDDEISVKNGNRDSSSEEAIACEGEAEENMIKMKKPDWHLPCPRCESLNTKFCYFNNCNAKQPRHLCRSCQRYWTAGGTLRKVPMGSGRRKSKHSSSSTSHLTTRHFLNLSSGLSVRSDALDSAQQLPPTSTSSVFTITHMKKGCPSQAASNIPKLSPASIYRNKTPLFQTPIADNLGNGSFETYASNKGRSASNLDCMKKGRPFPSLPAPDIPEQGSVSIYRNETPLFQTPVANSLCNASNEGQPPSNLDRETTEASFKLSVAQGLMGSSPNGFPMGPWPYGLGLFGWNNATMSSMPHNDRSLITPLNAWCGHLGGPWMGGLPWPLMHHVPSWPIGPWDMPIPTPPWGLSPTLGKHPREGLATSNGKEGCILTPKTLRIRNPLEATQSSIWSALGLDSRSDLPASGIFKGFPPKVDTGEPLLVQALLVNPAAMTRSMVFHENT